MGHYQRSPEPRVPTTTTIGDLRHCSLEPCTLNDSDGVRGLIGVGSISVGVLRRILSHRSLRRLIAVEVSDPESNSDSDSGLGDGALA